MTVSCCIFNQTKIYQLNADCHNPMLWSVNTRNNAVTLIRTGIILSIFLQHEYTSFPAFNERMSSIDSEYEIYI